MESVVGDIPAGDGKTGTFFYNAASVRDKGKTLPVRLGVGKMYTRIPTRQHPYILFSRLYWYRGVMVLLPGWVISK
jgi:hypothetical protein